VTESTNDHILRPRVIAASAYAFYMIAGTAFLFLASTGLKELLGTVSFILWNALLMAGGAFGFIGAATNRHRVEIIGVPGVVSALIALTLFIGSATFSTDTPGITVGLAAICGGAALGTVGRGIEIFRLVRITDRWKRIIRRERRERREQRGG